MLLPLCKSLVKSVKKNQITGKTELFLLPVILPSQLHKNVDLPIRIFRRQNIFGFMAYDVE